MIELDVQLARDGAVVVVHDWTSSARPTAPDGRRPDARGAARARCRRVVLRAAFRGERIRPSRRCCRRSACR
jgi:glycerophosphoryl diester phosphodiesterase